MKLTALAPTAAYALLMRCTARATGIAMRDIEVASDVPLMSVFDYKRIYWAEGSMSAFGGKADIHTEHNPLVSGQGFWSV